MAFCGNCGATLKEGSTFCGGCGQQASVPAQQPGAESKPVAQSSAQAAGSGGQTGWTPVSAPPPIPAAASPRPDTMAWSSVPSSNSPAQEAGWSSVPVQPSATPAGAGQNWNPAPQSATAAPVGAAPAASSGLTRNMAGALAYSLGIITGILFIVLEPYKRDRFVRFHAMQSILYFVFAVAFSIAWSIVVGILMHISGWFFVLAFPIRLIISLAMFGLWLYLMFQAYNDREFRIPILGAIASKQAGA
ncbi:MAG TPA: hypothetical protein VN753_04285 [Terracidiphilus sp.]|nr:hypothetical protein [Terracidiphilus sp.]